MKTNSDDNMAQAIERNCASLDGAGVAGKGTSAALRAMRDQWMAGDGKLDPAVATGDARKGTQGAVQANRIDRADQAGGDQAGAFDDSLGKRAFGAGYDSDFRHEFRHTAVA